MNASFSSFELEIAPVGRRMSAALVAVAAVAVAVVVLHLPWRKFQLNIDMKFEFSC